VTAPRISTTISVTICVLGVGWFVRVSPMSTSGGPLRPLTEASHPTSRDVTPASASSQFQPEVQSQASSGLAFVINSGEASISLVDVTSCTELRHIPVVREPHHMALTPDRRFLVVGDTIANELLFLDPTTGDVVKRITVSDPYQFGRSPDGKCSIR